MYCLSRSGRTMLLSERAQRSWTSRCRRRERTVRDELAKQLSAFANTGGGQVIYGLTNTGAVDNGGVARSVRGRQSTKEWLENVIPNLTDFRELLVSTFMKFGQRRLGHPWPRTNPFM